MSLTSILRGSKPSEKEFQAILREIIPDKKSFKTISGKEAFSKTKYEALVPYDLVNRYNASVVGTAFDYLARIMLARVVKKNRDESYTDLVADQGLIVLSTFLANNRSIESKIQKKFRKAKKKLKAYCKNKKDIKKIIVDACFLAKLEHIFRSGLPPTNLLEKSFFNDPDEEIIKNLEQLCDVFQEIFIPTIVSPKSEIIYNPTFGVSSAFVGGADGDVIIDGTLYDFKTTKHIGYRWQEIAQIVGYFLLNELSLDVSNESDFTDESFQHIGINRIAFYRARYGEVEYIDLSYLDKKQIDITKRKLASYFAKNPNFSFPMIENLHILKKLADAE